MLRILKGRYFSLFSELLQGKLLSLTALLFQRQRLQAQKFKLVLICSFQESKEEGNVPTCAVFEGLKGSYANEQWHHIYIKLLHEAGDKEMNTRFSALMRACKSIIADTNVQLESRTARKVMENRKLSSPTIKRNQRDEVNVV